MEEKKEMCGKDCEVFSRIVGYFRPIQRWNEGKKEEFTERLEYAEEKGTSGKFSAENSPQPHIEPAKCADGTCAA
jgi:hypothetical protein